MSGKKVTGNKSEATGLETALKVCPFCGSSSLEKRSFDDPAHYIRCNECGAVSGLYASEEKAVAGWNMRATSERIEFAEIVRHLKERGVITEADVAKLEDAR